LDLDRQTIERRDFPIARRGYDPVAVDAHLRALAAAAQDLQEHAAAVAAGRAGESSLGSAAASQIQVILDAASTTAADIERTAAADAARARAEAADDAARTRADAIARAEAHVAAVATATATLLARVQSLDATVATLVQSVGADAGRLADDLASVQREMGDLYDAASGQAAAAPAPVAPPAAAPMPVAPPAPAPASVPPPAAAPAPAPTTASVPARTSQAPASGDIDGARLVALNMALNGDSREQADRYLSEHFDLPDRARLLDEVYAAIEV
jgi:hypothetical protein